MKNSGTNGKYASGNACSRTDQVEWSRRQLSWSAPTYSGCTTSASYSASPGSPGAGYCMSNSGCGKPKKSWMVLGRGIAVTAVALTYQCADTDRIEIGRASCRERVCQYV